MAVLGLEASAAREAVVRGAIGGWGQGRAEREEA